MKFVADVTFLLPFLVALWDVSSGFGVRGNGRCPKVAVKNPFNIRRYLGVWHEAERFPTVFQEDLTCAQANYTTNGEKLKIVNSGLREDGSVKTAEGVAYQEKADFGTGKLKVRFSDFSPYGNYWVLDTDYEKYAVVYACTDLFLIHFTMYWVLVRDLELMNEDYVIKRVRAATPKDVSGKADQIIPTKASDCARFLK